MNKIYKSIDDIKLSDRDKKRMYNNIMEQSMSKKRSFGFKSVLRFVAIVMAICIFSFGSVYAMVKIFNWDSKFLEFFGINQEEVEKHNLENSEINKSIKIDDMNITIKQATMFDKTMYFLLDVTFDNPKEILDIENNNSTLDVLCGIKITKETVEEYGNLHYVKLNDEKTNVIVVASIDLEETIKKGDNIKIGFLTNYIEETYDDGSGYGYCQDEYNVDWTVDIDGNNEKIVYDFNEKVYVKNDDIIKIYPTRLTITSIDVTLDLILETDLSSIDDEYLRFDNAVNINFNVGKAITLNGVSDDDTYVHGSNIMGVNIDDNGNEVKGMSLVWDNLLNPNNYTKSGLAIIDIENIKNIQIGNNVFELNK